MEADEPAIERVREVVGYQNQFVTVFDDDVRWADGHEGSYLRIRSGDGSPGVVVVPRCGDLIGLVHVFRYPIGRWEWSFPRGFGEVGSARETAERELVEELGEAPDRLEPLGSMTPDSGLQTSVVELFVAEYREPVDRPKDRREVHAVRWVPSAQLLREIQAGAIIDGFTLSAVALAIVAGVLRAPEPIGRDAGAEPIDAVLADQARRVVDRVVADGRRTGDWSSVAATLDGLTDALASGPSGLRAALDQLRSGRRHRPAVIGSADVDIEAPDWVQHRVNHLVSDLGRSRPAPDGRSGAAGSSGDEP